MILAAAAGHSEVWDVLFQLVALLACALGIGMLFERFGQSAILGYLVAGMLLGPGVFNVVDEGSGVPVIAELGVSLLLFAIGLEFSARRLIGLGPAAMYGGTFQVSITLGVTALAGIAFGLDGRAALALGAAVALSSTACVLRVLTDRAELEAVHGRTALGILLLQDVAVVPLVLFVTMLGGGGSIQEVGVGLLKAVGLIVALVTGFLLLSKFVLPRIMRELSLARDRELLVLLAVVLAVGSALAAHSLSLSPALGAFLAGMMLAESPFATQIRSDIGGLRIIFITLFFASVGMLGDPAWIAEHWLPVIGMTILILVGKSIIITGVALLFRLPFRHAVASGLVLAQVGEFGVVIAGISESSNLMSEHLFRLLVSSTLLTLFATPLLIRYALPIGRKIRALIPWKPDRGDDRPDLTEIKEDKELVFIVGFGPSGQRVAEDLKGHAEVSPLVIDMRQNNIDLARSMGHRAVLGDASSVDFLIHHGVSNARAVVITIPDPRTSTRIVESVRTLNEKVSIIARARYHMFVNELENAGATIAVDEEYLTGHRLREAMSALLMPGVEDRGSVETVTQPEL
jgi:CPA2 family monovalent cation:H+ antiporter-2